MTRPPQQRGHDLVHISQLAAALGWSSARVRSVDDILKPVRLANAERVYDVDRALAFVNSLDDILVFSARREAIVRRNETRQNLAKVKRRVNAVDPLGLLRIGAPVNVYENETREILSWLPDCRSERQVRAKLRRLFAWRFTSSLPNPVVAALAKALYDASIRVTIFGG